MSMLNAMLYIADYAPALTGAYCVSAWADEVRVQGHREKVEQLVTDLDLTHQPDRDHRTGGATFTTYTGQAPPKYGTLFVVVIVTDTVFGKPSGRS